MPVYRDAAGLAFTASAPEFVPLLSDVVFDILTYGNGSPVECLRAALPLTDDNSACLLGDAWLASFSMLSEHADSDVGSSVGRIASLEGDHANNESSQHSHREHNTVADGRDCADSDNTIIEGFAASDAPAPLRGVSFRSAAVRVGRSQRAIESANFIVTGIDSDCDQRVAERPICIMRREVLYIEAAAALLRGAREVAFARWREISARYPSDLLALRLASEHAFNTGRGAELLRLVREPSVASCRRNQASPFFLGMQAFALVENDELEQAETVARRASDFAAAINIPHPWAHHAVAHVLEMTGRPSEGIHWMQSRAHWWDECNSFMFTHNWWHTALFHLELDADDTVLQLYDTKIWGRVKESPQDQAGAVSLLWRLSMRQSAPAPLAASVLSSRFADVADYTSARVRDHLQPFLDIHYAYCLAAAGRHERVAELLDSMVEGSTYYPLDNSQVVATTRTVALGAVAAASGDFDSAVTSFAAALPSLRDIGGSNAQRDIIELAVTNACLRSGAFDDARSRLIERAAKRPKSLSIQRDLDWAKARTVEPQERIYNH